MRHVVRSWPPTAPAHPSLGTLLSPAFEVMPVSKRGPFCPGSTRGRLVHVPKTKIWRGLMFPRRLQNTKKRQRPGLQRAWCCPGHLHNRQFPE